jgi:septal ring-binding cell division protein DamX
MTKDEMRALLAQTVPAAIADGRAYRFNRVGNGKAKLPKDTDPVRDLPNTKVVPMFKPSIPKRIDPATQRPVQTFKPQTLSATPYLAHHADNLSKQLDRTRSAHALALRASRIADANEESEE